MSAAGLGDRDLAAIAAASSIRAAGRMRCLGW